MEGWTTIKDAENRTKIPHQTIRRYLDRHGHHLRLRKRHHRIHIHKNSIELLEKIRSWYSEHKNADQVDELLLNDGIPMTIDHDEKDHGNVSINFPEVLTSLTKRIDEQQEFNEQLLLHLNKQDEHMRKQNEKLQSQQELLDKSLAKRDEQLVTVIREIQETKQQLAATPEKKWWKFWK